MTPTAIDSNHAAPSARQPGQEWYRLLMPGAWSAPVWVDEIQRPLAFGVVRFTPELAEKIRAERMPKNRPLQSRILRLIKADLRKGAFLLNGESIIFDERGNLIDGQHRLAAGVQTGLPFSAVVVVGVPDDAFRTIDGGGKRTAPQVFALLGLKHHQHAPGAIMLYGSFLASGVLRRSGLASVLTACEARERYDERPGLLVSIDLVKEFTPHDHHLFAGTIPAATLHYIFAAADREKADAFMRYVMANTIPDGPAWSAVKLLRDRMVANRDKKGRERLTQTFMSALAIKAWNALLRGKRAGGQGRASVLKWDEREPYPRVAGWSYAYNDALKREAPVEPEGMDR